METDQHRVSHLHSGLIFQQGAGDNLFLMRGQMEKKISIEETGGGGVVSDKTGFCTIAHT